MQVNYHKLSQMIMEVDSDQEADRIIREYLGGKARQIGNHFYYGRSSDSDLTAAVNAAQDVLDITPQVGNEECEHIWNYWSHGTDGSERVCGKCKFREKNYMADPLSPKGSGEKGKGYDKETQEWMNAPMGELENKKCEKWCNHITMLKCGVATDSIEYRSDWQFCPKCGTPRPKEIGLREKLSNKLRVQGTINSFIDWYDMADIAIRTIKEHEGEKR